MNASLQCPTSAASNPDREVLRLGRASYPRGFRFGFRQQCLIVGLSMDASADLSRLSMRLSETVQRHLPYGWNISPARDESDPAKLLVKLLVRSIAGLQEAAGIPVESNFRAEQIRTPPQDWVGPTISLRLAIPSLLPRAAADALQRLVIACNAFSSLPESDWALADDSSELDKLLARLQQAAPSGSNRHHWMRAALELGIPYQPMLSDIFQLGWGRRARLFRASETDATSNLGAVLAKNKLATAALLRMAGIPVPDNEMVGTADAAVLAAGKIGFPVVVKPADQDRGVGVTTGLMTEARVRHAFEIARSTSAALMVERHVEGREYRLLVVHGRLFWAYERVPARVIGDGRSTIDALIVELNRYRTSGPSKGHALVAVAVTPSLCEYLEEQGQALDSIPGKGEVVRLQRVPSNAGGGAVVAVFDDIHPDNAAIAERAARLLRLDIAGIDLLSPDISRSWREVGGRITEVNHQPQISPLSRPDMHRALLSELIEENGRVPVAMLIGSGGEAVGAEAQRLLAQSGVCAGLASPRNVVLGQQQILDGPTDIFRGVMALIVNPDLELVLAITDCDAIVRNGLPLDRIDLLVLAGAGESPAGLRQFLSMMKGHLKGKVLLASGDPATAQAAEMFGADVLLEAKSPTELAVSLCDHLVAQFGHSNQKGAKQ